MTAYTRNTPLTLRNVSCILLISLMAASLLGPVVATAAGYPAPLPRRPSASSTALWGPRLAGAGVHQHDAAAGDHGDGHQHGAPVAGRLRDASSDATARLDSVAGRGLPRPSADPSRVSLHVRDSYATLRALERAHRLLLRLRAAGWLNVAHHRSLPHMAAPRGAGHPRPRVTCGTHVWEITENPPKPYLNRYDTFVDDGSGNCVFYAYDIETTTINSSVILPVLGSQETFMEAPVIVGAGGMLMITPSSVFAGSGAALYVDSGGTLEATDSQVIFTSANASPQPGDWDGIAFWAGSTGDLANAVVAYAGQGVQENNSGLCCAPASIYVADGATPSITDSTVDHSSTNGIQIDGRGAPTINNDTITNSGTIAYHYAVYYDNTPSVAGVNAFFASGDIHNSVRLPGGTVTGTLSLLYPGIPVEADGTLTIAKGGSLFVDDLQQMLFNNGGVTVSPGGTMNVDDGAELQFSADNNGTAIYVDNTGVLTMTGEADSPITLTSAAATPQPGDWGGIAFWPGSTGALTYLDVAYAGAGLQRDPGGYCCMYAGIYVNHGANPTITQTTVEHSRSEGFELDGQDLTSFSAITATNNGDFAAYYDNVPARAGANLFVASGNVHNSVRVPGGTLTGALSLAYPGLPTELDGMLTITSGASLSLDHDQQLLLMPGGAPGGEGLTVWQGGTLSAGAGTHLAFAVGNAAALYVGGTVNISGTPADPIVLASAATSPNPGDWGGVAFWSGGGGTLNNVQLSYPGAGMHSTAPPNVTYDFVHTGIYVGSGANPTIANTAIDHSAGEGFELDGRDQGVYSGDGASKGADFAVYYDNVPNRIGANLFTGGGNAHDAVRIPPGTVSGALSLVYPGLPVQIDGALTITHGASLTIDPYQNLLFTSGGASEGVTVSRGGLMSVSDGTLLQFTLGHLGALYVDSGGTLDMTGTATAPITLTSAGATPHPSDWSGVAFWPGSTGRLSYVHESFAGYGLYTDPTRVATVNAGLYVNNGANTTILTSTVDHSLLNGFEIDGRGAATFAGDSATNNGSSDGGFAVYYDHTPSVRGVNLFTAAGNGHDAVRLPAGTVSGALSILSPGIPVQVDGMLTITRGASLRIDHDQQLLFATQNYGGVTVSGGATMSVGAGARVLFEAGRAGALYVDNGGTLTMTGTATDPISLTGTNATPNPGDWSGVAFWPGSRGGLSYVHLSGGGFSLNTSPGQCCANATLYINNAAPAIQNVSIDHGQGNDVEVANGGLPILHGDSFGAVQGNQYLGVKNDNGAPGPAVDARYDWWGDPSGPSGAGSGTGVAVGQGITFTPWLGAAPGSAPPRLTSSRAGGGWLDSVTISGTNFGAGEPIRVYWDSARTAPLSGTTSAGDGSFVVTFSVPQAVSGTHTIIAVGQTSALSATITFLVRPKAFLQTYRGVQGTPDVLAGTGFARGEVVKGYWNALGGAPFSITATANSLGSFGLGGSPGITFTVPLSPTGVYRIYAVGQSSHGVAATAFTITP